MWRRTYLFFVLVRLYFALSASYLHPDENFQGPEVIAGQIFSYPVKLTWEFTSEQPVRSVFPLWPIYGLPMLLLRWLWIGNGNDGEIPPIAVFWTLRVLMFVLSFVLEDWAIHELIESPRQRMVAVFLVASSYVTWTYQTHTFSNSIETLAVAWSLVIIQRVVEAKQRSSCFPCAILAFIFVFGIFNRITFPAFLLIPCLPLIPHFIRKPFALISALTSAVFTTFIAVYLDTKFYTTESVTWTYLFSYPTVTPFNNLVYNLNPSNLATHGLHPWYQHIFINLPLLIGPAVGLLLLWPQLSIRLYSAISGIVVLSIFQHQEARFLLPTIPLVLSSVRLPRNLAQTRVWIICWIIFNAFFGILMGVYHQGGVIPAQVFLSKQADATQAVWWKTYSPPIWLLNGKNAVLTTHDAMGMNGHLMLLDIEKLAACHNPTIALDSDPEQQNGTYLVAPLSAVFLDPYISGSLPASENILRFEEVWRHTKHLNLDDLDFEEDGFWDTLKRVVGRRGLGVWRVTKECFEDVQPLVEDA